ncbi:MAG TPA: hypothetical protein PKI93_08345, partial [Alphaproteobacteria bacterium]|nr:hypothetical protein [Alphaproteobacteria bacterium]
GSAASTVTNGQTVTLQVAAPAAGTEGLVTLTIGTATYTWTVRTIQSGNVVRVFTSANTIGNCSFGGVGAADSFCTNAANVAGLAGNWVAVVGQSDNVSVADRLPWNWTMLKNMNGALVATSLADFMDGSVSAPMNYTESNGVAASGRVWTGLNTSGVNPSGVSNDGDSWSRTTAGNPIYGDTSSTGGGSYFSSGYQGSTTATRLLCMETTGGDGTDVDPLSIGSFTGQVVTTPGSGGGKGYSNTVTLSGVSGPVPIQITPSAGAVDILLNGVSVGGATVNAYQNDTLSFVMDAPDVEGTKNTATITLGTDTYDWWVGYANPANEAVVFVTETPTDPNLGGLIGADNDCQSAATTAGYSGTWTAILSSSTVNAADRLSFNWATLKRPDGAIVANGWNDLWDGTIQNPINVTQNGTSISTSVWTNTSSSGVRASSTYSVTCNDWTSGAVVTSATGIGTTASALSNWIYNTGNCYNNSRSLYCLGENVGIDEKPSMPATTGDFTYAIQVPTSTLTTSNAVTVAGLGSGVSVTVTITGSDGSPGFKVNGVAGTSGVTTVSNGDSLELTMTSAATASTSHSMTVTVGPSSAVTWRVWTGDPTGTVVKRVFVHKNSWAGGNLGGLGGADVKCNTAASSAGLGGSWKAILSGDLSKESEWAINRIGYNWSELRTVTGATVVYAPNLWNTSVQPLLAPINKTATGADLNTSVATNTNSVGKAVYESPCADWTSSSDGAGYHQYGTTTGTGTIWVSTSGTNDCRSNKDNAEVLYCIEQ